MKKLNQLKKNSLKILMSLMILLSSISAFSQDEIELEEIRQTIELCDKIVNKCEQTIIDAETVIKLQDVKIDKLQRERDKRLPWYFWVLTGGIIGTQIGR